MHKFSMGTNVTYEQDMWKQLQYLINSNLFSNVLEWSKSLLLF